MTDTGESIEERLGDAFTKASTLIPMDQVKEHYENLRCGNLKTKGCNVQKDFANLYYCRVCMSIQALGTDFFSDDKKITDNMLFTMQPWQHKAYNERAAYNLKWLNNYPRGATG